MDLMQRRRVMLTAAKKARLPREYQEVRYIETDGSAYINTNISPTNNMRFVANFQYTSPGVNSQAPVFATYNDRCQFNYIYNGVMGWGNANSYARFSGTADSNVHIIDANKDRFLLDGETIYTPTGTIIATPPKLTLLATNAGGTVAIDTIIAGARIFDFMIINNVSGVTICHYIPCRRKSDNKLGMYDLCGSICPLTKSPFYINAGTGEFLVGPDVN